MAIYKIHLAKIGQFPLPEDDIKIDVQDWFLRVIKSKTTLRNKYHLVEVVWWKDQSKDIKVGASDILVYLVKNERDSIIKKKWNVPANGIKGLTYVDVASSTTTSEAYCGCRSGRFIAETIFHEALHNKTGWSDQKQHPHGGLGGAATSIISPQIANLQKYQMWVPQGEKLTDELYGELVCKKILIEKYQPIQGILTGRNMGDMARFLDNTRKQWTEGFQFLRNRNKKIKIDLNDPLGGI